MLSVNPRRHKSTPLSAAAAALPAAASVISRRHKSTPLSAVAGALPAIPRRNGHGHPRAVAVASATAGVAVGAAVGFLLAERVELAADGDEAQAPEAVEV
jgi:hypothetical protein